MRILWRIITKLGRDVACDKYYTPVNFEVTRSKVKVTGVTTDERCPRYAGLLLNSNTVDYTSTDTSGVTSLCVYTQVQVTWEIAAPAMYTLIHKDNKDIHGRRRYLLCDLYLCLSPKAVCD